MIKWEKMTIQEIYNLAISFGIKADPRGKEKIKKELSKEKNRYQELKKDEREEYDKARLKNPYSDTRILCGDPNKKVKKILAGLGIEVAEILLADRLKNIDLIISHHPLGRALANLDDVMKLQIDLLTLYGVPVNVAEHLTEMRMSEVSRRLHPTFFNREIQAAELLDLPLISVHTPADNLCFEYVKNKVEKADPETLGDLIKILKSIPEYKKAAKEGAGPKIFAGKPERRCGKIAFSEITGGTSGHKDIYARLSHVGISTLVGMHMSEEYKEEAERHHINVVIAGHAASDSLGMNLFLDEIEKGGVKIIPCAGLGRVKKRNH